MAAASKKTEVALWETDPADCKSRMKYVWTLPDEIKDKVATATDGSGDSKIELTLSGESDAEGVVAEHTVSLKIQGPAGTDIADGSISFKVTVGAKAVVVDDTVTTGPVTGV